MTQLLKNLESPLFYVSIIAFFMSMILYWIWMASKSEVVGKIATGITLTAAFANGAALLIRFLITHRAPLTNGYEFLLSFTFGITVTYLVVLLRLKMRTLGPFVTPILFLLLLFVVLTMSTDQRISKGVMPALDSYWLAIHVSFAVLSYSSFAVSFCLGIMYLIQLPSHKQSRLKLLFQGRFQSPDFLDTAIYKVIGFGYPMLTLCIITGAIWANYSWGSYWSWDPKETWSLVTWLVYSAYLHTRIMKGWKGKRSAWMAVFGFIVVLFTFFGVNYLLTGLHSYGR